MKTINLILILSILTFSLNSCKKNKVTTPDEKQMTHSETLITIATYIKDNSPTANKPSSRMSNGFSVDDLLNYDFCFTFLYPITLSYNNGTTVEINDSAELLQVAQGMTQNLYINGISFPFDVQMADGSIQTVNNETDFSTVIHSCDTDNDGTANYQDTDDDNDTIPDNQEDINQNGTPIDDDSDGDGTPNYQDADDDNDGIPTADENYDDQNGNVANEDSDNDGTPNYLDTDSDNDGTPDGQDNDANGDGEDDNNNGSGDD